MIWACTGRLLPCKFILLSLFQLDIRTTLSLRDGLYRLAKSAEQRHGFTCANSPIRASKCTGSCSTENLQKYVQFSWALFIIWGIFYRNMLIYQSLHVITIYTHFHTYLFLHLHETWPKVCKTQKIYCRSVDAINFFLTVYKKSKNLISVFSQLCWLYGHWN